MGQPLRCSTGGILGLVALPQDQWGAIEADLFDRGFFLEDVPGRVSWRLLKNIVKYSQRTSALFREMFGEQAEWSVTDHLLASILDTDQLIAWLASDTKRNKRPDPIKRPGMKQQTDDMALGVGSTVPVSEFWSIWNSTPEQQIESDEGPPREL